MKGAERETAERMAVEAADAIELILTEGVSAAMTRYNRRVQHSDEESE